MPPLAPVLRWIDDLEQRRPDDVFLRYLEGGDVERPIELTYAGLAAQTRAVAAHVVEHTAPTDRVLLLFPPGTQFASALFGTQLAGCIAVPAYTPDPNRLQRTLRRLRAIIADSGASLVLTTSTIAKQAAKLLELAPDLAALRWTGIDDLPPEAGDHATFRPPGPDALAYLQYTSGSTSAPKGVRLTHANIAHNVEEHWALDGRSDILDTVSWLPVHHDFGLVLSILAPLGRGVPSTLLSPIDFILRPACWLEAMDHYDAHVTGGPTFGYALAARKVSAEQAARYDLSALETCVVSAEHVRHAALQAFAERFAPAGVTFDHFAPAFGLAEITVIATGSLAGPRVGHFDPDALRKGEVVVDPTAAPLVSSGRTADATLRIVQPDTHRALPERTIGEIWLSSASVGDGYWNRPELSEERFGARVVDDPVDRTFLRTGDLGFQHDGELYVTGRMTDVIIVAGRNLFPHDIENLIETAHPACRPGNGAAFAWQVDDEEQLGVAVEVDPRKAGDLEDVARAVRDVLRDALDASPAVVALLKRNTLPKTSSGKRQRRGTATALASGDLEPLLLQEAVVDDLEALWKRFVPGDEGDFFERGGRSIDLLRLADAIEARFGVLLPLPDLLADPSLTGMRAAIDRHRPPAAPERVLLDEGPASPTQERMALVYALDPTAYQVTHVDELTGPLDIPALERAVRQVVEHHRGLRTRWFRTDDGLRQQVVPASGALEIHTCADSEAADAHFLQAVQQPFALDEGRPWRAHLYVLPDRHVLAWVFPHVAIDGWSVDLVRRDLWSFYADRPVAQPTNDLIRPTPPTPASTLSWWKDKLADAPRTVVRTFEPAAEEASFGCEVCIPIDGEVLEARLADGRAHRCTPYTTLLSLFLLAVHHWTDEDDIVIGTLFADRGGAHDVVGCFIETAMVRSNLGEVVTWADLLDRTRTEVLDVLGHLAPHAEVMAATHHERADEAFEILFNYVTPSVELPPTGLTHRERTFDRGATQLDLAAHLHHRGDQVQLVLEYRPDRHRRAMVERLAHHLRRLLTTVEPSTPVRDALLLGAEEHEHLLTHGQGATHAHRSVALHTPVFEWATRDPERLALSHGPQEATYSDLVRRAETLAFNLDALGVRPADIVAVDLPRSIDNVAAQLAISRLGACILPLPPGLPHARRTHSLADSGAKAVVTVHARAGQSERPELVVDRPLQTGALPADTSSPDADAVLLYTSGSTGLPNGVRLTHDGLANRLAWFARLRPIGDDERHVQKTDPSFADALTEVFAPLWAGVPQRILDDATVRSPTAFLAALEDWGTTRLIAVPSLLGAMAQAGLAKRLPTLRLTVSSGEALPPDLLDTLERDLPHMELWNLYGSTEVHLDATGTIVNGLSFPSIGRPVDNLRVDVRDRHGALRPVGLPGELWVAGRGLSPGYHQRPVMDVERFVERDGLRWFRTGDVGARVQGGHLVYIGRNDHQVKIRGARVDLREVSERLRELPSVHHAVAHVHEDQLVAYLEGAKPSLRAVRDALVDHLPAQALPTRVVHLEALPLLPSGKIDRKRLPAPTVRSERRFEAPVGPLERTIATVWSSVLGVERIGRHDDFFDLGGHSLLAMHSLDVLERELGRKVTPALLFQATTAAALAKRLTRPAPTLPPNAVWLQEHGDGPPLFVVHGVEGTTARLRSVAHHFEGRRQVIGLESPALSGDAPLSRIDEMVDLYSTLVQRIQPDGPLLLSGFSFGGIVAFALSQELERQGREVRVCVLLDTRTPLERGRRKRLQGAVALATMRAKIRAHRVASRLRGAPPPASLEAAKAIKEACQTAFSRYQPQPWSGSVVWFRTHAEMRRSPATTWFELASDLNLQVVEGDHQSWVREPLAGPLAERLLDVLDDHLSR